MAASAKEQRVAVVVVVVVVTGAWARRQAVELVAPGRVPLEVLAGAQSVAESAAVAAAEVGTAEVARAEVTEVSRQGLG